jgi:hypothetical protein
MVTHIEHFCKIRMIIILVDYNKSVHFAEMYIFKIS